MVSHKIQKIIYLLVFLSSFITLIEAAPIDCPTKYNNQNESLNSYIVLLKNPKENHVAMLTCLGKQIIKSYDHINGLQISDAVVFDFSVEGLFSGYAGKFTDSFMTNYMSKRNDVLMVGTDAKMKISNVFVARKNIKTKKTRLKVRIKSIFFFKKKKKD